MVFANAKHWCVACQQFEQPDGAFCICAECGHVYPSAAELVARYNAELVARYNGEAPAALTDADADSVLFCQECLHDF